MQEFAQNKLTTIVIVCLYIGSCLIHTFHQFHGGENVSSITWNAAPAPQILRSQMSSDKSVLLELDIDMKLYLPNPTYSQFKSSWLSSEQKSKEQSSLIEDYVGGGGCILSKQPDWQGIWM